MKFLYNLTFIIFAVISIPKFLIRLNQAESGNRLIQERLGSLSRSFVETLTGKKVVWLHAVSVGEVMAAREWIKMFQSQYPDWHIALSTTTPTGQEIARQLSSDRLSVFYAPFDISFVVRKVLKLIEPRLILLMETEIWPNLITEARKQGVAIGIINGRISPRSFGRYWLIKSWLVNILKQLSFCLVQTNADHKRFLELGMPEDRLNFMGNMKFDMNGQLKSAAAQWASLKENNLIYVAGSTHWNEEEIMIRVFKRLQKQFSNLKLILAPRHPETLKKVTTLLANEKCNFLTLGEWETAKRPYEVLVIDRMGVLASIYSIADLVFIGGSFVSRGGQNPIEASYQEKPILHGPNIFNFEEIYQRLDQNKAAAMVQSEEELYQQSKMLLENSELRKQMGTRALSTIQSMKGATARTVEYLSRTAILS